MEIDKTLCIFIVLIIFCSILLIFIPDSFTLLVLFIDFILVLLRRAIQLSSIFTQIKTVVLVILGAAIRLFAALSVMSFLYEFSIFFNFIKNLIK